MAHVGVSLSVPTSSLIADARSATVPPGFSVAVGTVTIYPEKRRRERSERSKGASTDGRASRHVRRSSRKDSSWHHVRSPVSTLTDPASTRSPVREVATQARSER